MIRPGESQMKHIPRLSRWPAVVGLLVALPSGAASPIAHAQAKKQDPAAPSSLTHACVARDGSVRLVLAPDQCRPNETAMQWNVVGPQGPQGPPGLPGPSGATGATGPEGPVSLNWRGVYDPTQLYLLRDAVFHAGSSWVATAPVVNVTPDEANAGAGWQLLARAGRDGDPAPVKQLAAELSQLRAAHAAWLADLQAQVNQLKADLQGQSAQQTNATAALQSQINTVQGLAGHTSGLLSATRSDVAKLTVRVNELGDSGAVGPEGPQGPPGLRAGLNFQLFYDTDVSREFVVPAGVSTIQVELWGGGGGGGVAGLYAGGGGGGAAYFRGLLAVTPGETLWTWAGASGARGSCSAPATGGGDTAIWKSDQIFAKAKGGGPGGPSSIQGGGAGGARGSCELQWSEMGPNLCNPGGSGHGYQVIGAHAPGGFTAPGSLGTFWYNGGGDGGSAFACQTGLDGNRGAVLITW
jgi:hypothetical protein